MSDEFDSAMNDEENDENEIPTATPEEIFSELDAQVQASVPEGQFITFRVESGQPIYVPLEEGEPGITIHDAIVRRGLTPGERVIVEGLQKARPGTKVNPTVAPVSQASATAETAKAVPPPVPKPTEAKAGGKAKGK